MNQMRQILTSLICSIRMIREGKKEIVIKFK